MTRVPGARPVSRRTVLRGLGLAGLGAAAGCGAGGRDAPVRVGVVWSGSELTAFRAAVRDFTATSGRRVSVVSLGDDAATLLSGDVARAVAPDVAILPQPTLVRTAGALADLSAVPGPAGVDPLWRELAADANRVPRGVWYKATHKSLVWYRPDVFARHRVDPPDTWAEWVEVCDRLRRAGVAPLALGAADGWVVTDWFENVLLGLAPDLVDPEAAGRGWDGTTGGRKDRDRVAAALQVLAGLWSRPGVFPGGPARSLLLQYGDAVLDVVSRDRAAMVAGADFTYPVARRFAPAGQALDWFPFPRPARPTGPAGRAPVLVGGDLAVLLEPAGAGGRELIRWLATPGAAAGWVRTGGFVSLRREVTGYPAVYRDIPEQVRRGTGIRYDLSDRLPAGRLAGGDGRRGLSWILQEFLRDLGRGGSAQTAVEDTLRRLSAAAEPPR